MRAQLQTADSYLHVPCRLGLWPVDGLPLLEMLSMLNVAVQVLMKRVELSSQGGDKGIWRHPWAAGRHARIHCRMVSRNVKHQPLSMCSS